MRSEVVQTQTCIVILPINSRLVNAPQKILSQPVYPYSLLSDTRWIPPWFRLVHGRTSFALRWDQFKWGRFHEQAKLALRELKGKLRLPGSQ